MKKSFQHFLLFSLGWIALPLSAAYGQMKMPGDMKGMKHGTEGGMKFRVQLATPPKKVKAGTPTQLTLSITDAKGKAAREFEIAHTKLMHLIVVSKDLAYFAHIHPAFENERFVVTHTFPFGGPFRLFADFTPKGSTQQVVPVDMNVEGRSHRPVALTPDKKLAKTFGKYLVTLSISIKPQRLKSGSAATLTFAVATAATNQPVEDLEDYLGARGHCVILREGAREFIHAHPMEDQPRAHGKMPMGNPASRSEVMFHAAFPKPGVYKVWAQMKRQGKVFIADFVVKVQ